MNIIYKKMLPYKSLYGLSWLPLPQKRTNAKLFITTPLMHKSWWNIININGDCHRQIKDLLMKNVSFIIW